ncbi:BppU family phage baseplate upper protein, partial [Lactiplantibacillus mudanjiangensis]|uniref:BppU family phage baseplate upper protein n=1 Tax=Lactiplantibacillus mudanjiangensis TaxID=1296538 RepID=UPI0010302FD7
MSLDKQTNVTIDISPTSTTSQVNGNVLYANDLNTNTFTIDVLRNGVPVPLSDNTSDAVMVVHGANFDDKFELSPVADMIGRLSFERPTEMANGTYDCQAAISTPSTGERAITTKFSFTLNGDLFGDVSGDDAVKDISSFLT